MNFGHLKGLSCLILIFALCACGQSRTTGPDPDPTDTTDPSDTSGICLNDDDCEDGICVGGACQSVEPEEDTACSDDSDCPADEYCQYPAGTTLTPNSEGICVPDCATNDDCPVGQECIEGRCFSNYDCDPANNSCDCPGGEVCNGQTRSCSAPPVTCYFNQQCPCEWLCNADNECFDPNNLGGCVDDSDCDSVAGCQNGNCECADGACRPSDSCTGPGDCPDGSYCANGVCQPSPPCNDQLDCTPYGLVCEEPYCVDPEPCDNGNCPPGYTCADNYNPPVCLPDGSGECTQDLQCPAGEYCDLFSNTCAPGCRDDADCVGQCGDSALCTCNNNRQCVSDGSGTLGGPCDIDANCPGGTICAYDDPQAGITCDLIPVGNCDKSCRQVCDLATSAIIDTCPPGQSCGGDDTVQALLNELLGSAFGSSSGSVCY